ncbi:hypothetical protein ROJ8625_02687 [Roseivivax jejudonensis]|uniref:Uncharacterized protein n=1 Tax=Roseivivax jejudonensis TaxID=1529041 RepID=A0A1X6ZJU0_9RHOB|nr:hypothetical protein ROJ8625_02687 [Roseivivax jejudonensis]
MLQILAQSFLTAAQSQSRARPHERRLVATRPDTARRTEVRK